MNPRAAWFAGSKLPCRVNVVTIYPFDFLICHTLMGIFANHGRRGAPNVKEES